MRTSALSVNLSLFITCSLALMLTACGGGSSSGSDTSSPVEVSPAANWQEEGTFGDDLIVHFRNEVVEEDSLYRYSFDTAQYTKLSGEIIEGGKIATIGVSPDGKKVAYLADQDVDNRYELYVSNSVGTSNIRISHDISSGDIRHISWSANSRFVLYEFENKTYVFDFESLESQSIGQGNSQSFAWSPVGSYLALMTNSDGPTKIHIYDLELGFSSLRSITPLHSSRTIEWSYDGSYILLEEYSFSGPYRVTVYDATETQRGLIVDKVSGRHGKWSPDSNEFVFWQRDPATNIDYLKISDLTSERAVANFQITGSSWGIGGYYWLAQFNALLFTSSHGDEELYAISLEDDSTLNLSKKYGYSEPIEHFKPSLASGKIYIDTYSEERDRYYDVYIVSEPMGTIRNVTYNLDILERIISTRWLNDGVTLLARTRDRLFSFNTISLNRSEIPAPSVGDRIVCLYTTDIGENSCSTAFIED